MTLHNHNSKKRNTQTLLHTHTHTQIINGINNHWSLISLNINGLNSPIKRHRLRDWIWKQDPTFCCLQETHLKHKDRHLLRVKGWEKVFQANEPKKQAAVAILISNKIDFKLKSIRRDGDGHFILLTGTINQEKVSILNIYTPNIKAPTYVKEKLLELKAVIKTHTNSRRLQHTSLTNGQVNQTET